MTLTVIIIILGISTVVCAVLDELTPAAIFLSTMWLIIYLDGRG